MFQNPSYQFKTLPLSPASAPHIFTKLMQPIAAHSHKKGISMHIYLNDWLIRALERSEVLRNTKLVIDLGLIILNLPKSNMKLEQIFISLRIQFYLVAFLCQPYGQMELTTATLSRVHVSPVHGMESWSKNFHQNADTCKLPPLPLPKRSSR